MTLSPWRESKLPSSLGEVFQVWALKVALQKVGQDGGDGDGDGEDGS